MTVDTGVSFAGRVARRVRNWRRAFGTGRPRVHPDWVFHHEGVLGTSLELQVRAPRASTAREAEIQALREIERLDAVFNSYQPTSELRRWQATRHAWVALSPELLHVLQVAEAWQTRTGGAFHPASEEWTRLWKQAEREQLVPTAARVEAVRTRMAQPQWRLDAATGMALRTGDCALTLNAIAKGYIVDRACAAARSVSGVEQVLVNIGGDLRVSGPQLRVVGITDPRCDAENAAPVSRIQVREGAVATSGGYRRGFRIGDAWYSHLFDPRTGEAVREMESVSVVAPTTLEADVLATAFSVLPVAESVALADAVPHVGCFLVKLDGSIHRSRRWVELEIG